MIPSGPQRDPEAVAMLERLAREARERLPATVERLVEYIRTVDPIELLSQLTVLFQSHTNDAQPDREKAAHWQARIEWLVGLVFARRLTAARQPAIIDDPYLQGLEALLDECFRDVAMSLPEPVEGLTDAQNELRALIQAEALFVRGEAFQIHFETTAHELYAPHDDWCLANLGLTVADAISTVKEIPRLFEEKMTALGAAQLQIGQDVSADPTLALALELPEVFLSLVRNGRVPQDDASFAKTVARIWFFSKAPKMVSFEAEELRGKLDGRVSAEGVDACLRLLALEPDGFFEPNPLTLTPLAQGPLVHHDGQYFTFVPALLISGLFYAFHSRLFADAQYRTSYDDARAAWLERSAVDAFRQLLPRAEAGWSLTYGPKAKRVELDGLIRYDNKLILIECKWKSPTLVALSGDVVAALKDFEKAIIAPLAQSKRTRDYIQAHAETEFIETSTGRRIVIRRADVTDVFLVTMVGSGAWAMIAANLVRLVPLGFFHDNEYPWALSINDLRVVADCLDFPSQLFDFLRRRFEAQRDPKFKFHDEWDLLGVYIEGALDVEDPRYAEPDFVALDGFDSPLQDYYYSLSNPLLPRTPKPRRNLPTNIRELLREVERAQAPEKTDAICVVLSWPNWGIEKLGKALQQARGMAITDGRAHAVALRHPWRASGVTFACGYQRREAIQDVLWRGCESQRASLDPAEWVGFGIDLSAPWDPIVIYYNKNRIKRNVPAVDPSAD